MKLLLVSVLLVGLTGCVSREAAILRAVENDRNVRGSIENVAKLEGVANYWHEQAVANDRTLLEQRLAAANAAAMHPALTKEQVAEAIATNYIDYFSELDRVGVLYASERAKIASLAEEQRARIERASLLAQFADRELRVPAETAKLAFNAAFTTGLQLWKQYQLANPPVKPGEEPEKKEPVAPEEPSAPTQEQIDYWNTYGYTQ